MATSDVTKTAESAVTAPITSDTGLEMKSWADKVRNLVSPEAADQEEAAERSPERSRL